MWRFYLAAGADGLVVLEPGAAKSAEVISLHTEDRAAFPIRIPEWLPEFLPSLRQLATCLVAVIDYKVDHECLIHVLEYAKISERPLVLVCEELSDVAGEIICLNLKRDTVTILPVIPKAFGDRRHDDFRDLAFLTGAEYFSAANRLVVGKAMGPLLGIAQEVSLDHDLLFVRGKPGFSATGSYMEELTLQMNAAEAEYD